MSDHKTQQKNLRCFWIVTFLLCFLAGKASAESKYPITPGNFGLPGIIDLPTAKSFPDGELVLTHQNHKYIFMNGISFQALPYLGVFFDMGGKALVVGLLKDV